MKKTVFLLLAFLLLTSAFSACGKDDPVAAPLYAERGETVREALGDLAPAEDANSILAALTAAGASESARWEPEDADTARTGPQLVLSGDASGDTVVTDGSSIFMLDSYGLVTVSAAGTASEVRAYTKVARDGDRWGERLYLWRDRIAVVWIAAAYDESGVWRGDTETRAIVLSVMDPAKPEQLSSLRVDGSLVDACMIDGNLCVVTQKTLLSLPDAEAAESILPQLHEGDKTFTLQPGEIYLCPNPSRAALTVTAAIRMEDGRFADVLAFTDGTEAVCAEGSSICLARTRWNEKHAAPRTEEPYSVVDYTSAAQTEIKRLRFDGGLKLEEGCVMNGALSDPGALELRNGQLRLATDVDERSFSIYTDEKHGWTNYEGTSHVTDSQLAVLDAELNPVGALARLGGETGIRDCRFLGATAWITAGDTLSAVDLSTPADPQIRGSFSVSGEVLILRDLGKNCVLALALPAAGGKLRLTVYDLSDPAAPKELDSMETDALPAGDLSARGALFADAGSGWIGWPAIGEDGGEFRLVRWTGSKLDDEGALRPDYVPENVRALLLNGQLYLCSPGQVCVADPENGKVLATVSNAVG